MQRQAALHLLGLQETVRVRGSVLLCDVLGGFEKNVLQNKNRQGYSFSR